MPGANFQMMLSKGGAASDIPTTSLYLWHRSDYGLYKDSALTDPVTADADTVGGWVDKSGNGRNWTQATSASEPTYKTAIVNSLPVLRFDGSDDFFDGPNISALTAAEVFIVVKCDADPSSANGLWRLGNDASLNTHFPFSDGTLYDTCMTNARKNTGNPTPSLASWRLYNVVSTSSEWTNFIDGTQFYTTATNTVGGNTATRLGRSQDSGTYFDGDIAELIIYSAKLGTTDKDAVESYVATRYGLTIA